MFKAVHLICTALLIATASSHAQAEVLKCVPGRMCYDHRPCSMVDDPQEEYCADRPTCDAMGGEGMFFTIVLPTQGAEAELYYPGALSFEARVLSRFTSKYQEDPKEQITLSTVPTGDADAPNKNLIYLEVDRTSGVATAKAVNVDMSTDIERGTVTTYSDCKAE